MEECGEKIIEREKVGFSVPDISMWLENRDVRASATS